MGSQEPIEDWMESWLPRGLKPTLYRYGRWLSFHPGLTAAILAALWAASLPTPKPPSGIDLDQVVELYGWVRSPLQWSANSFYFEVKPLDVSQAGRSVALQQSVAVFLPRLAESQVDPLEAPLRFGDRVAFRALLREPAHYAVPGVPDARTRRLAYGVYYQVRLKSPRQIQRLGRQPVNPIWLLIHGWGERFRSFCQRRLTTSQRELVLGAFLGERRSLSWKRKEQIQQVGATHLFVVSGFHVWLILSLGRLIGLGSGRWSTLALLGIGWAYVILVNAPLPSMRSALMLSLLQCAKLLGIQHRFLNGLGWAAAILLALWPACLWTASFQLSFFALLAIGVMVRPCSRRFGLTRRALADCWGSRVIVGQEPDRVWSRKIRFGLEQHFHYLPRLARESLLRSVGQVLMVLLELVLSSLLIQLLLLPFLLYHFNQVIWTQPLANLVLVPLFVVFAPLCLLLLLTPQFLSIGLAKLAGELADLMSWLLGLLELLSQGSFTPHPTVWELTLYLALVLSGWVWLHGRARLLLVLPPFLLLGAARLPKSQSGGDLTVTLLDVGQGESIHLLYPDGREAMVDTGGQRSWHGQVDRDSVGRRLVSRYLWQRRSRGLAYVLFSHPHSDHIQGLEFLVRAFPISRLYFHQWHRSYHGPPARRLRRSDRFWLAGVEHRVIHPPGNRYHDINDASLVLRISYGAFSLLLTGDIEARAEQSLELQSVLALKVAHHGAAGSSSEKFLRRVRPTAALISAGRHNPFGHPSIATIRRLGRLGIPAYSTAQHGSLRLQSDGLRWRLQHYSIVQRQFVDLIGWRQIIGQQ